jgi:hypothetical protein
MNEMTLGTRELREAARRVMVTIRVDSVAWLSWRFRIASHIFRLGAWVAGVNFDIEVK